MGKMGEKIKESRMQRGLTQQQLGVLIGVSKHTVIKYEKNEREPNLETLTKIINILDLDFWDIAPIDKIELEPTPPYEEGIKFFESVLERRSKSMKETSTKSIDYELKKLRDILNENQVEKIRKKYIDVRYELGATCC